MNEISLIIILDEYFFNFLFESIQFNSIQFNLQKAVKVTKSQKVDIFIFDQFIEKLTKSLQS